MKELDTWKMYKTLSHAKGLTVINLDNKKEYILNKNKRLIEKDNRRHYNPKLTDRWIVKQPN